MRRWPLHKGDLPLRLVIAAEPNGRLRYVILRKDRKAPETSPVTFGRCCIASRDCRGADGLARTNTARRQMARCLGQERAGPDILVIAGLSLPIWHRALAMGI
jgi:hypothetical protein